MTDPQIGATTSDALDNCRAEGSTVEDSHQYGLQLYREARFEEAVLQFEDALLKHESSECWNDWAAAEAACGRADKAEEGFRRALALSPSDGQTLANLGALLARLGRLQEAVPPLQKALARLPEEPQRPQVERLLRQCRSALAEAEEEAALQSDAPAALAAAEEPYAEGWLARYQSQLELTPFLGVPVIRHIVSLGVQCFGSFLLKKAGLKRYSGPFDEMAIVRLISRFDLQLADTI